MKLKTRTNQPVEGDELENLKVSGDLEVKGDISVDEGSDVAIFENIVDADGHKRFIEGEISLPETIANLGITKIYGKWSLSGTHLMIVFAIQNQTESNIIIPGWNGLYNILIPQWIYNKLYGMANTNVLAHNSANIVNAIGIVAVKDTANVYIEKQPSLGNYIGVVTPADITLESGDYLRIAFDLLIDNE